MNIHHLVRWVTSEPFRFSRAVELRDGKLISVCLSISKWDHLFFEWSKLRDIHSKNCNGKMEQIKADLGDLMGFEHTWNIPEKKTVVSGSRPPCRYCLLGRSSARLECTTFVQWMAGTVIGCELQEENIPGKGVPVPPIFVFPSISCGDKVKLF